MPTATTAGFVSLNNLGSLTTTFTAPSSCTTAAEFVISGLAEERLEGFIAQRVRNCDDNPKFPKGCLPYGDEISKQRESLDQTELATLVNYYSPGLHCPYAWETVGYYAAGTRSNGSSTTAAQDVGVFSPTAFNNGRPGESTSYPYEDFVANMLTSVLASTETAVVCCPTGYTIDPYGGCISYFPARRLAEKTGCFRSVEGTAGASQERYEYTYDFWGDTTTVSRYSFVFPTDPDATKTVTFTFDSSGWPLETEELMMARPTGDDSLKHRGLAAVNPLYLVHSGEDNRDDEGGADDEDEDEGDVDGDQNEDNNDDDEDDDDSAAGRLSPGANWVSITGVLATWGFSAAAGLGLLIAW